MLHAQFTAAAGQKSLCCPHIPETKRVFSTAVCGTAGKGKGMSCFQCEKCSLIHLRNKLQALWEQKNVTMNCMCVCVRVERQSRRASVWFISVTKDTKPISILWHNHAAAHILLHTCRKMSVYACGAYGWKGRKRVCVFIILPGAACISIRPPVVIRASKILTWCSGFTSALFTDTQTGAEAVSEHH